MFFGYIKLKIRSWNKLPLPGVIAPGSFPLHSVTPGVAHPDQRYDARNIRRVNFGFNHLCNCIGMALDEPLLCFSLKPVGISLDGAPVQALDAGVNISAKKS